MNLISPLENLVSISVVSLTPSNLGSNSYILLLKSNEDENIVFPIVIGPAEAQTISVFIEEIEIPRPLTAQLTLSMLDVLHANVSKVVITDFKDGIFYSLLYLNSDNKSFELDARPSDAIALAIKSKSPIFIFKNLLQSIAIPIDEVDEINDVEIENTTTKLNITELSAQLNKALENEDYETAAEIRDQIEKLKIK